MSHTNTTTNYGLPQFLSSDKPAWMADINVAFSDIDAQMKTNADAASAAQTTADDSVLNGAPGYSNLSTYSVGDVINYLGRVYKCDIAVTTPEAFDNAKWSYYRLSDASAQLDVIDGEIGSTDISEIGDGTITGAISTVNSNLTKNNITFSMGTGWIVNSNESYVENGVAHISVSFVKSGAIGTPSEPIGYVSAHPTSSPLLTATILDGNLAGVGSIGVAISNKDGLMTVYNQNTSARIVCISGHYAV